MSSLTVLKTSEAEAVVEEAQALERETRSDTERWLNAADDLSNAERMEDSQARYQELRAAAQIVVALLYRIQEPLLADPYAPLAAASMNKAKALLADIEAGELVEKVTLVPASSDKECPGRGGSPWPKTSVGPRLNRRRRDPARILSSWPRSAWSWRCSAWPPNRCLT